MSNSRKIRKPKPKKKVAHFSGPTVADIALIGMQMMEGVEMLDRKEQIALLGFTLGVGEKLIELAREEQEGEQPQ